MYVEPYEKKNDSKYENRNICIIVVSSYFKGKKKLKWIPNAEYGSRHLQKAKSSSAANEYKLNTRK